MKDELVQFVFILVSVVIAAALEELVSSALGVALPLLLSLILVMSPRLAVLPGVITAVGAGAFEDALSSLPPLVSICFFVIAALLSRKAFFPPPVRLIAYPAFALWCGLCGSGPIGDLFLRVLFSLPMGVLALAATAGALSYAGRKAGLYD